MKNVGDRTVLTTTEARQGERTGMLRVLVYSMALALIVGLAMWLYFAVLVK